jgi:translation elongation factor EF-Ts
MYEDINYETASALNKQLTDLLRNTQSIQAIKLLRAATGGGLLACKHFVEALEAEMETACPCCSGSGRVTLRKAKDINARMPR